MAVHAVQSEVDQQPQSVESADPYHEVFTVWQSVGSLLGQQQQYDKKWMIPLTMKLLAEAKAGETSIECQLDTGSSVNIMTSAIFKQLINETRRATALLQTAVKLRLYDGSTLTPQGECKVQIRHEGQECNTEFVVIEGKKRAPLISAEMCERLGVLT